MMDTPMDESELSQLVDGELDSDRVNEVLLAVLDEPGARARLMGLLRLRVTLATWRRRQSLKQPEAAPVHVRRFRNWRSPWLVAACLLLAVVGWGMYLWGGATPSSIPIPGDQGIKLAGLTPQEVADRVQVFDQVWNVFDGRAEWVLIADKASDLGIGSGRTGESGELLLLRLSVSRDGTLFSTADLVVVPGETAQVDVPSPGQQQLRYEVVTSASEPGHLRFSVELQRTNGQAGTVAGLAGELYVRLGQVASAGEMVAASGRYEVSVGVYRSEFRGERT